MYIGVYVIAPSSGERSFLSAMNGSHVNLMEKGRVEKKCTSKKRQVPLSHLQHNSVWATVCGVAL